MHANGPNGQESPQHRQPALKASLHERGSKGQSQQAPALPDARSYARLIINPVANNAMPCLRKNAKLLTKPGEKSMLPNLGSSARLIIKPGLQIVMLFSPSASVATIHLTHVHFC